MAVDDVQTLTKNAKDEILRIKFRYCIDYLMTFKLKPSNYINFSLLSCCSPYNLIKIPEYVAIEKDKKFAYEAKAVDEKGKIIKRELTEMIIIAENEKSIKENEKNSKENIAIMLDTEFFNKFVRWFIGLDWTMADIDFENKENAVNKDNNNGNPSIQNSPKSQSHPQDSKEFQPSNDSDKETNNNSAQASNMPKGKNTNSRFDDVKNSEETESGTTPLSHKDSPV